MEATDVALFRTYLDKLVGNDALRVIVITGAGNETFCFGASLKQMKRGQMSGPIFDTFTDHLASVRLPTICALNGGGAKIVLCCDFRLGVSGSRLSVPAAELGIYYSVGGMCRYVERLGLATTNRILLAAEEMDSAEMLRVGFLTHCFAPRDLRTETGALVERLSALAPLAVQGILLDLASGGTDLTAADELVARCAASEDSSEELRARREGRPPRFHGC